MKHIRQAIVVLDLVYDDEQMTVQDISENAPDFIQYRLSEGRENGEGPYYLTNPTLYISGEDFRGDVKDGLVQRSYYRGHVIESGRRAEDAWACAHSLAVREVPVSLWWRNQMGIMEVPSAPSLDTAIAQVKTLIDARYSAGKYPDVHEAEWIIDDQEPFIPPAQVQVGVEK